MPDHASPEPIWFPWQRVKRTLVIVLFTVVPTLNIAIPQIVEAFDGYVDAGTFAVINAVAAGILLVSGIIEAFVTPSGLPTWARITIGVVAELVFLAYVFGPGRSASRAGGSGDIDESLLEARVASAG